MGCRISREKRKRANAAKAAMKNLQEVGPIDRDRESIEEVFVEKNCENDGDENDKSDRSMKSSKKEIQNPKPGSFEILKPMSERKSNENPVELSTKKFKSKKEIPNGLKQPDKFESVQIPPIAPIPEPVLEDVAKEEHQKHEKPPKQERKKHGHDHRQYRHRKRQHDNEDDTLYEVPLEMPTIDLMQEYYEQHRNQNNWKMEAECEKVLNKI